MFHVERIYKCNHAGGQAGPDKRAPQRAGQEQRMPAPQGPGKNQECLPPRAGQEPRVPAPKGLRRVVEGQWSVAELPCHGPSQALGINNRAVYRATMQALLVLARPLGQTIARFTAPPCRLSWFLPGPWDKQSRGLPRHHAGFLCSCPALWDRQSRGLPRHLCPFIRPCLPPCYPSHFACWVSPWLICREFRGGFLHPLCMIRV